jgi:hypothetical protein
MFAPHPESAKQIEIVILGPDGDENDGDFCRLGMLRKLASIVGPSIVGIMTSRMLMSGNHSIARGGLPGPRRSFT